MNSGKWHGLKVVVTKNEWAHDEDSYSAIYTGIVAIEGYFQFERAVSLYSSLFLFPVATALFLGIVSTNIGKAGIKCCFSSYSANILAHLIYFLNKWRDVNLPKNSQIGSALPIQYINYGSPIYWRRHVLSAMLLCHVVFVSFHILNRQNWVKFVEASPIHWASESGKGNKFFTQQLLVKMPNSHWTPQSHAD